MEIYAACFQEVFGFPLPDYEEEKKPEEKLPIYKYVEYPDNFYIPKSQYESCCRNISIWKKYRYTPYKRISHFREHLNRLQGCQFITIPNKLQVIVNDALDTLSDSNDHQKYYFIKEVLRKNRFSQFNEHIHYLISQKEKKQISINYEDYHLLCRLFQEIENVFQKKRSDDQTGFLYKRKNLISYYLIIQLLLYIFHYHPNYSLPTLYDEAKRKDYYLLLLGMLQNTTIGLQLWEEHFRRKKTCFVCQSEKSNFFDKELLSLL